MTELAATAVAAHSSVVGSSTAKRVLACPRSIDLAAMCPPAPESPYAAEGSALHMAVEHALLHGMFAHELVGSEFYGMMITKDLVEECIVPCLDAIDRLDPEKFFVERRGAFPGIDGAFGTADVVTLHDDGTLRGIVDWKFGAGVPVSAEGNPQAMFLLCSQRAEHGRNGDGYYQATFVQPRLGYDHTAVYTDAELDLFETALHRAVYSRRDEMSSGDHCRWCPARVICPIKTAALETLRKRMAAADTLPAILDAAQDARDIIAAAEELALDLLGRGIDVPGYKLVRGRGARKWVDEQDAVDFLNGNQVNPWQERKVVSPAQAEKRLGKRRPLRDGLAETTPGALKVAPESDKAPAVRVNGAGLEALAKIQGM